MPSSGVLSSHAEPIIPKSDVSDKQTLLAVLQFLKKNNLKDTEELLKREAGIKDDEVTPHSTTASESDVSHALAAYKSSDDPSLYSDYYTDLKSFIDSCLDVHKVELAVILYPVFVHMYLELVYNGHENHAVEFFEKFHSDQEDYYQDDLRQLSTVVKREHMQGNTLMENFKSSKFVIKMSRDSYIHLKRRLQEKKMKPLLNIVQEHLFVDVFDGMPRNKQQIQLSSGAVLGESEREANRVKVYYGLLKEPDINIPLEEEEEAGEGDDKPKKKKQKKDPLLMKKSKNDPNAPQNNRIPLPELKDSDKIEKITVFREATKRVKVNSTCMPSICFYTLLNSFQGATCVEISEDSSLLAAGFSNSAIRVFSLLNSVKLRTMKKSKDLDIIDKEAEDVLERMMDDRTASEFKVLLGHSGPVYATNFSRDRKFLISASEDGTNLCCALFHPNSNYIATGSSDRVVRMWDNLTGNCVRILTGHKGAVQVLCFSPDGRFLVSSGVDRCVLLWDISSGSLLANMKGHTDTVYSLAFSRDGAALASGGLDNHVKLWDIHRVLQEVDIEADLSIPSSFTVNENPNLLFGTFPTKSTPVLAVHFTRRNLLLASGPLQT
ncbi:transcription initiation factor TFIID subunit 5-like [Ylistrum balloti]|uniref:transcription initiation factor TFIID subunit 5-like n=1 Tax=Ylistrum balloti TaxID=509963 RepID=UPI002905E2A7|nr:transcription initiation factor TFIID subunit 5-like [Ylistrum balloti]